MIAKRSIKSPKNRLVAQFFAFDTFSTNYDFAKNFTRSAKRFPFRCGGFPGLLAAAEVTPSDSQKQK